MDRHSSHSQRVPYARTERRKSLLSKVKDSVKEMLSPSWLTDLVTNVKKDQPATPTTGNAAFTGQQAGPSVSMPGPAAPQMAAGGLHTPEYIPFQGQSPAMVNGQPRTLEFSRAVTPGETLSPFPQAGVLPPPVVEFTSSQLPLARLTDKSDSVLANEDTMSQRSDVSKSTSGCSSMVPQLDVPRDRGAEKRKVTDSDRKDGSSSLSPKDQPSVKRQRLHVNINSSKTWSHRLNESNISMNQSTQGKPAFNVSLLASPMNESSILGSSFHESSFYPGKTSFGGKSSMSFRSQRLKQDLNQSLPSRLSIPVKAFMKAKPRANPEKEAVTSATAKRIMDALNKIPTPLNDARKIPVMVPNQWTENPSYFAQTRKSPVGGPPKQRLNVSSLASISKNRQVSASPLKTPQQEKQQTRFAEDIPARRQETIMVDTNGPSAGASGKIRREKSYHRPSAAARSGSIEEEEDVPMPNLRSDFTLPVSQLPKFSFSASSSVSSSNQGSGFVTPNKPPLNFTFSSPIQHSQPEKKQASPGIVGGFQFSSPITVDKQQGSSSPAKTAKFSFSSPTNSAAGPGMTVQFSTAPKPKPKTNGPQSLDDSVVAGIQPPTEMKTGSVMDILGKSSSKPASSTTASSSSESAAATQSSLPSLSSMFKQSGWSCDVCLINNKPSSEKCVACMTPKPNKSADNKGASSTPASSAAGSPSKSLFKQVLPTGTWTCDVCLIQNKSDITKCAACQTPKPGASSTPASSAAGSPSKSLFKQVLPTGTWTCDVCLIQNKSDITKCAACQTPKPGDKSMPLFGKIEEPKGTWTCDICLIKNKPEVMTCAACQTSKPNTSGKSGSNTSVFDKFKPAAGQWNCEVCLVQNKADTSTCVACQTPKPSKPFKHPPGDWTCDTCLVSNKESDVSCVACRYTRPGAPRTQTVPSCAKSYSMSQAGEKSDISIGKGGGFTFGSTDTSKSGTKPAFTFGAPSSEKKSDSIAGGFKFGASSSDSTANTSVGTGIKFGAPSSDSTANTSLGTGFTFGAPSSVTPSAGIKFGAPVSDSNSTVSSGGFKFGAPTSSTSSVETKSATGPQLGNGSDSTSSGVKLVTTAGSEHKESEIKATGGFGYDLLSAEKKADTSNVQAENKANETSTKTGFNGFQFGKTDSGSSLTTSNLAPGVSAPSSNLSVPGFTFGQTSVNSQPSGPLKATTSVPGGFSFQAPSKETSSVIGAVNTSSSQSVVSQPSSIGGFSFSTSNKSETSSVASSSNPTPTGGFSFGTTNNTQENAKPENKTGFGGFVFGQQKPPESSTSTTSTSSGFNFAQNTASSQLTSEASTTKRGIDEDSGETTGKKPMFSFGGAASTGAFQFKATTSSSSSSTPFVFGQQQTSQSSAFAFPADGDKPVFGTSQATENKSDQATGFGNSGFNFNAPKSDSTTSNTNSAPEFKFGATPAQSSTAPAFGAGSSSSVFGGANTAFGSGTAPAFGGGQMFGMQNSSTTPSAPVFGGTFGGNAAQAQQPAQNSTTAVFQFGSKPSAPETSAAPGFPFTATPAPAGSASLNFGATPAAPPASQNSFSVGGTGTGLPQSMGDRKIRRAIRKIRR